MLFQGKFADLNALLEKRQEAAIRDVRLEDDIIAAYEAFWINDRSYESLFNRWIAEFPNSYLPYLARAKYFYNLAFELRGGKWASETSDKQFQEMKFYLSKSEQDIQQALQRHAKGIMPYYLLVGMDRSNKPRAGKPLLAKALEVEPASLHLRAKYLSGITPRWGGSYEEMQEIIDESIGYLTQNPRLAILQGYPYYDAGDLEASKSNYANAELLLTKAISFGDDGMFLKRRAGIRFFLDKADEALRDINRAIELWPHDCDYYDLRSKILASMKRRDEALRDIEQADILSPGNEAVAEQKKRLAIGFEQKGYAHQKSSDPQAAIGEYNNALRANPDSAILYLRRAKALIDQNKLDDALVDLDRAVDLDPNDFDTFLLLDWVLTRRKDWDRIIRGWDKYIALHLDHSRAYVERSRAFYHKGDLKSAVKDLKKAADLGDEDGRQLYERFKGSVKE